MILNNWSRVCVKGVNQHKIYKLALKNKIKLKNIQKIDFKTLNFDVETSKFKNLIAICEKNNYNISIIKQGGFLQLKQLFCKKAGCLVAIICVCVLLIFSQSLLWNIKIYGADNQLNTQIKQVMQANGVMVWCNKNTLNTQKLVQEILKIKGISMASASIKGTCLIVNVKQKTQLEDVLENK